MSFTDLNILNDSSTYKNKNDEELRALQEYKKTDEHKQNRIIEISDYIIDHFEFNRTFDCIVSNISDVGDTHLNELIIILENKGFKCVIDDQDILTINI